MSSARVDVSFAVSACSNARMRASIYRYRPLPANHACKTTCKLFACRRAHDARSIYTSTYLHCMHANYPCAHSHRGHSHTLEIACLTNDALAFLIHNASCICVHCPFKRNPSNCTNKGNRGASTSIQLQDICTPLVHLLHTCIAINQKSIMEYVYSHPCTPHCARTIRLRRPARRTRPVYMRQRSAGWSRARATRSQTLAVSHRAQN